MISFMLLGLPRSGTTWASNWLTTDTTLCLHDPLFNYHYTDLDLIETSKTLGLACTGLYGFPDWVNSHPSRKVILHRDIKEVNESLEQIGLSSLPLDEERKLYNINGLHVFWRDLFTNPKEIYETLTGLEFDPERHSLLKEIEMQPQFSGITVNKDVTRRLLAELRGSI